MDAGEVVESLKHNYKIEILSVKKQFPNVLNVEIKERREIYYVESGGVVYVATEDGFIIDSFSGQVKDLSW